VLHRAAEEELADAAAVADPHDDEGRVVLAAPASNPPAQRTIGDLTRCGAISSLPRSPDQDANRCRHR
jgi:hypothetical protein